MASARSVAFIFLIQGIRTTILEYRLITTRMKLYTFRLNKEGGKSVIKSITIFFYEAIGIGSVVGWLVAAPLFFTSFLMPRDQHTQTPIYQNTREHFEHIFKQSSQQSNRAVALLIYSAGSDQQMRIQALSRPVAYLGVYICVFSCFLSIIILQSCLFEGISPSLFYQRSRCDFFNLFYL